MNQSLTCLVVTREGSFDAVLRNDIYLRALKTALNLEEEVLWCLAWLLLLVQELLSDYTVKLTIYKEILKKQENITVME